MKVLLKKGGLFVGVLVLILIWMDVWMDRELYPHYPLQYEEVFSPRVKADVVILGASHATHGINPRHLETDSLRVFNFALNGAGPGFYWEWYQKIFSRFYPKPRWVIYAVHWIMFDDQLLKRKFEMDSKYFPSKFFLKILWDVESWRPFLLNRFAFIRERKQLAGRLFGKRYREVYPVQKYYQGFIPFETKRNLNNRDAVIPCNKEAEVHAFERLLDAFEKDGIKVIFVQVPGYLPGRQGSEFFETTRLLHQIAQKRQIPFLDYETEKISAINTDQTLFSDWAHLNEKGSEAFSKMLARDLKLLFDQMGQQVKVERSSS